MSKIHWDEDTIALHDLQRGTRMKINEPNTPYNHYQNIDEDILNDMKPFSLTPKSPLIGTETKPELKDQWNEFQYKLEEHEKSMRQEKHITLNDRSSINDSNILNKTDKEISKMDEKRNFSNKRKAHYNEFEMMRLWKEEHKNDMDIDLNSDMNNNT